jgi:hypothetical protein
VFWIGVYPGLTTDMLEFTVKTIGDFMERATAVSAGKRLVMCD